MSASEKSADCGVVTRFCDCVVLRNGELVKDDLFVRNGVIVDPEKLFYDEYKRETKRISSTGYIIAPGFIDVQINGAAGFDFSTVPDNTRESEDEYVCNVHRVSAFLLRYGVTSYCPTLVSSDASCYAKLLPLFRRARREQAERQAEQFGSPSFAEFVHEKSNSGNVQQVSFESQIIGVHLEGPFISPEKKGAHDESVLRNARSMCDLEEVYGAENLDGQLVKVITLAPEALSSTTVIQQLVARGVRVSVGHSNATFADGEEAVRAGATFVTHLFNCMQLFHHREPALLGLLTSETRSTDSKTTRLYFGVIADGIHTHHAALRLAHSAHPNGLVLVTDAIAALGLTDGAAPFRIGSRTVELLDGAAYVRGSNKSVLSGARVSLDECVRNYVRLADASREDALQAASTRPAQLLGLNLKGSLQPGAHADFVVLDKQLNVLATYIRGRCVYTCDSLLH